MHKKRLVLLLLVLIFLVALSNACGESESTKGKSPIAKSGKLGEAQLKITGMV
ncbi:MAG: hypothetical protein ACE5LX_04690 [Nitrospinota bacterium]